MLRDVNHVLSTADSETAKAMMPGYHVGSLDEKAKSILGEGVVEDPADPEPKETLLDSRSWSKAILHSKVSVSWDTRIFRFKLHHEEQKLGLPIGQHLMIRLRDPATREAIIRSYTPISHQTQRGYLDVLVKVYFDTNERRGGEMSQAMDALPIGHFVDIKGPIGKFEYLGKGRCAVNGKERAVKKFVMVCGGSGITPIFQVFRAVMEDKQDGTHCTVINGNRLVEDILCREDLDRLALDNTQRCNLLHTLTQAPEDWKGLRGRVGARLLEQHAPAGPEAMVLICGPEALEKSVHKALTEQGWSNDDLLFF